MGVEGIVKLFNPLKHEVNASQGDPNLFFPLSNNCFPFGPNSQETPYGIIFENLVIENFL
jgi:hypothetical protein